MPQPRARLCWDDRLLIFSSPLELTLRLYGKIHSYSIQFVQAGKPLHEMHEVELVIAFFRMILWIAFDFAEKPRARERV
jgi:hypothetical protein